MKVFVRTLILILSAAFASPVAAVTYTLGDGTNTATLSGGARVDAAIDAVRVRRNDRVCARLLLPAGCTRAQATALDANARVWDTNVDFLLKDELAMTVQRYLSDAQDAALAEAAAVIKSNAAPTNARCAAVGLANGCTAGQVRDQVCKAGGLTAGCIP